MFKNGPIRDPLGSPVLNPSVLLKPKKKKKKSIWRENLEFNFPIQPIIGSLKMRNI